eukprot:3066294-Prymnesium_polylepis.1
MQTETCEHAQLGMRHPSYCKLAAVAEALHRGYEQVAFLDSDAFFQNVSMGLPALERAYGDGRTPSADVMFAWDRPFSYGPNAGVQFWRNSAAATRLLAIWWNLPGGRFHMAHDYEQHALQWKLQALRSFRWGRAARAARAARCRPAFASAACLQTTLADARAGEHGGAAGRARLA